MNGPVAPPPWVERLLDRVVPPGPVGDDARSELRRELEEHAAVRGPGRARRWYVREALLLAAHFTWERLRPRRGRVRGTDGSTVGRIRQDLRYALRQMVRAPGFALVSVTTMALGIGSTVAIFSVVSAVLLDALPYDEPDRLVAVWEWNTVRDNRRNVANPTNVRAWRERAASFEHLAPVSLTRPFTVRWDGQATEVTAQLAHPEFFDVLGLEAALGRTFAGSPTDGPAEVVLSSTYWQQRFGGSPEIVGRPVEVAERSAVVVGVLPDVLVPFGERTDLWIGWDILPEAAQSGRWLYAIGRLRPGVEVAAAQSEMEAVATGLREERPAFNAGWTVNVVPLKEDVVSGADTALWMVLGAVGLLLVIACANVANLMVVRATQRRREMALRASLGASGGRLATQLLTEALSIAAVAALLGVGLAHLGTRALARGMPGAFDLPRVESAAVDGVVLLFAVGLTAATGLLFGTLPALQARRTAPARILAAEGRSVSRGTGRTRDALVVLEVALTVVLLSGAGLFARSLASLMRVDPGIAPDAVVVGRVTAEGDRYPDAPTRMRLFEELFERLEADPAVQVVGGTTFLPMDAGTGAATSYWPADRPEPAADQKPAADIVNVGGRYFEAMGIRLLRGRTFRASDGADVPQRVVVNRALAEATWPGEDPVGRSIVISWRDEEPWEVVGVVDDVRAVDLATEPRPAAYLHYPQAAFFPWQHVVVRAASDRAAIPDLLRSEVRALDPSLPVGSVRVMRDIVDRTAARPRVTAALLAVFAALATVLTAVGLYGVLAFTVSRRTREIGVRRALGADRGAVVGLVVRQTLGVVAAGLLLGTGGALLAGRAVDAMLFEVGATDPWALSGALALSVGVAGLAAWLPARRAARVPAATALRAD